MVHLMNYKNHTFRLLIRVSAFVLAISILLVFFTVDIFCTSENDSHRIVVHRKHENSEKKIALTFDDGPHPRYTPQILNILEKYNIKATFFVVGINAHYYPETFKLVVNSGHEIANHTYTHPKVGKIEKGRLQKEIEDCEDILYELGEYKTKLFRPPEGMIDGDVLNIISDLDYDVILWDIDTRDWAHTPANKIAEKVIQNISSGDIILMHDYIGSNSPTCEALELFIPELLKKGYKFVTVSELIRTE